MTSGPAVALLAKEIGARLAGDEGDLPTIPLFACGLLEALARAGPTRRHPPPAHPHAAVATTAAWAFWAHRDDLASLTEVSESFEDVITGIDNDDGWPRCVWLSAVYSCCLAVRFGLRDAGSSRWPAEAASCVADLVLAVPATPHYVERGADYGAICRRWACGILLSARKEGQKDG